MRDKGQYACFSFESIGTALTHHVHSAAITQSTTQALIASSEMQVMYDCSAADRIHTLLVRPGADVVFAVFSNSRHFSLTSQGNIQRRT